MSNKNILAHSLGLLIITLLIIFSITVPLSSAAPTSTGDNWKIVFDTAIDKPYNYSTTFTPKIWLYDQGGNLKIGATLTCSYWNVNDNVAITPCTVTSNGDGSYKSNALNMPTYADKYINVLFSVSVGSYTLNEQHVFFAGQSNAAHGALWKIQVLNTSLGPSWNGNNQQKIYIKLYSDAGTPYRNNFNNVMIAINGGTAQSMTYEEDGVYSYSISGYPNGEHYFEINNLWSGAPTGGAKNRARNTNATAGFYLEANNAQGDESSPEILSVERKPYFPADDDYVNITVHAVDNANLASRTLYYTVNNQSVMTKSMDALTGIEYRATLVPYLLEDNVRYRVEVSDGTNSVSSDWYNYNVQDHRGEPNNSHSFLSHPAYWFGKSRQASFADKGGDTNFDGTYSTTEKDNAAYLSVPIDYQYFKDMTRIKVQTLILDNTGKPVQSLTNVRAWLSNNNSQSVGTHNREKNMTEDPGKGSGVYTATWEGSANVSGTNLVWSDDAKAIWANYTSGEIYSVYIDLNNDGQPEENVTWLAYNFGDTYWGSSENGKTWGAHSDMESPGASCNKASCHDMTGELTSRTSGSATCPDCHGVYKAANNGNWPVETGSSANEDKLVYGNGTGHPRVNNTNATYCGDETCHDVTWGSGSAPLPAVAIPGYPVGTRLNDTFRAEYPNPIQCGEHHTYTAAKIPVEEGHNSMVACKYCHGGSHDNVKLKDYSISIQGTNLSNINRGTAGYIGAAGANGKAGDCYIDCHKTQVEHSLTGKPGDATVNYAVPCDECHQNFDSASAHQENMFPYPDREWCGTCHQAQGDLSSTRHNTSSPLDPSRIPAIQKHAQETGMRWNRTGERPYWVENEQSCRFCHGRSYNEAYGLGRVKNFMGNNILNGTINSTSYWCSSCHVNTSSQNYNNMVNTYNYSFGVVPPEMTGSTWKSNREGYDNHSGYGIDRTNSSTYSDDVCFDCHNGSLPSTVSMDTWQHQVSATGTQKQPTETYIPPVPTTLANTQGNFWIKYTWQSGAGNVTNSYNVSVNGIWTNGSASNTSNNTVSPHGWSNISVYAYNTSGTGKLSLTAASQQTRVANNVPVQSPIGNKAVTAGDVLSFTVSASDTDSDTMTYGTNATKGTLTPSSGAYTWTTTPGDVGTYIWYFNSSDGYGGIASETITVTVSSVPTYIPPAPTSLASTQGNFWIKYTWQAGSAGNVTNSYNVSVNGNWTNGSASNTSNNTVGSHGWSNISVYAYNTSGTGKLSLTAVSQQTRVANNVPVQSTIGNKAVTAGDVLSFTVSASDADSDVITYGTNSTKGTLDPGTGVYTWTTTSGDVGTYVWQFNSSDGYGGVASETITVTVSAIPTYIPPAPTSLASTQGNFWVNYTWQAGAGNVTNGYNVSVNSAWTNGTTLRYSNTTVGPHGWSNISVYAHNSSGTGKLNLTSASQNTRVANNVPVQAPIGNKVVSEGELLTFTVSATDADSDAITYMTNSTKGTLNPTTGVYSWAPGYADAGIYVWEFNSSDNYGGVDPEVITVTVNNVPLAITSSTPVSDPTTTVGTAQIFAINLNRTANVTWYINGSVVQTNSSVASASYTNLTAGIGIRNVTASASDGIDSTSRKWNWTVSAIPTYKISGYVFDNYGTGLGSVLVQNASNQTTTQASGYYLITGMYNGTYNFSYSIAGFDPGYLVVTINGADVINANKTILDTTPPGQVTGLVNATQTTTTINLSWTPTADASYYQIFRNSSLKGTTQNTYWNDTGLTSDSTYQYWVRANDSYNNWGQNSTTLDVRTASVGGDTTPPASVTNLVNVSYAQNYINWTWTDPSDTDFAKVMIYLNGIFQNNVSKGVKYFNATVSPGTYTIGTRTVDTTGNINATTVTHTATTILPSTRYINGTVMDSITKVAISGVTVTTSSSLSTTTNASGFYSFAVAEGTYDLTAKLDPTYYTNSTITVSTVGSAVVIQDIELVKKPTGMISGSVKTA